MEPNPYLVQVPTDMLLRGIAKFGNSEKKIFDAANKAHSQHTPTVSEILGNSLNAAFLGFPNPANVLIRHVANSINTKDQAAQKREQAEQTRLQQKDENLKRAEEAAAHDTHPAHAQSTTHTPIEKNHHQKPVVHATQSHTHSADAHPTTHTHAHPTTHTHAHPTTHTHAHPTTHRHSAHAHPATHPHK